jgi:hypothetical protein
MLLLIFERVALNFVGSLVPVVFASYYSLVYLALATNNIATFTQICGVPADILVQWNAVVFI